MIRRLFAALLLTLISAVPAFAAEPFNAAQKTALDAAIKQYIMDNPQVLISSVEGFYNKQKQTTQAQEGPLKEMPAGLLDGTSPSVGPKNAKVSVVEFFDYNCGYCKQVATDVERLSQEDKTVRIIFKDLPILSDTSEVAARYALAADKQGKYLPFHLALLQHQGPINEALLTETAKSLGIDVDKLKKEANTQDVRDQLAKNVDLARSLGIRGTPFFVIGKQKVPGAIGLSRIKEIIAQESGGKVSAAAPAAAAPVAAEVPEVAKVPDVATDAIPEAAPSAAVATPSADTSAADSMNDADTQAAINKARAEARAMVDQIKEEATKMQAEALKAQKDAMAAQSKASDAAPKK